MNSPPPPPSFHVTYTVLPNLLQPIKVGYIGGVRAVCGRTLLRMRVEGDAVTCGVLEKCQGLKVK